jgi:hypothetical protein
MDKTLDTLLMLLSYALLCLLMVVAPTICSTCYREACSRKFIYREKELNTIAIKEKESYIIVKNYIT